MFAEKEDRTVLVPWCPEFGVSCPGFFAFCPGFWPICWTSVLFCPARYISTMLTMFCRTSTTRISDGGLLPKWPKVAHNQLPCVFPASLTLLLANVISTVGQVPLSETSRKSREKLDVTLVRVSCVWTTEGGPGWDRVGGQPGHGPPVPVGQLLGQAKRLLPVVAARFFGMGTRRASRFVFRLEVIDMTAST